MGIIEECVYPNGTIIFRIRLKKKGVPPFSLSFETREAAAKWLDENEDAYFLDPEKYFRQRAADFIEMRRERVNSKNGMLKPRLKKFPNEIF